MVLNLALFLGSCGLIAAFAWYFCCWGQNALIAWIAILSLLANLFVLKQIELFHLNATASDIFSVGILLALNLLQEKFGRKATQQAIWISFSCLLFFILMSQIHLSYIPSVFDQTQTFYAALLTPAPRIMLASLTTFLIMQQLDSGLYHFLRQKLPQFSLFWISGITMSISQFADTWLFSYLGLYGMVSALGQIILVSYSIKLIAIANMVSWSFVTNAILNLKWLQKFSFFPKLLKTVSHD